jgi:hypothetical protein
MLFQVDFGNLAVGLGTALVAFMTWRSASSSSYQKLADFRREWIEDLRQQVAAYISEITVLEGMKENRIAYSDVRKIRHQMTLIQLSLNPAEDSHKSLLEKMRELYDSSIRPIDEAYHSNMHRKTQELVDASRSVFKTEWDKLRREMNTRRNRSK